MAKRGFKLQEFVAHSASVKCLSIGRKACRLLLTGGEDQRVNLWAIGKSTSLTSLCGHTSPVECVAFNSAEVLVLAGASSGATKLWDLEEAKLVRTLNGHRSKCTAVEFHPFGEFFASGSADTDLKIWDIRKKGCSHVYKGHGHEISTIKFTPDGRWVVSGGLDNVVKVWDLTAGKLLHDFTFHDGPISSIDFHPLEFLLATGSADGTVKFWDLETFEMIGSTRAEATGVNAMSFHPDGRTLFCGYDNNFKVYSWEPVICHDSVDMVWSTLGDISVNEKKLIGCSYYHSSIGIWAADLSLIQPYGSSISDMDDSCAEPKSFPKESDPLASLGSSSLSPDVDAKEIKNIYVDCSDERPVKHPNLVPPNSSNLSTPSGMKEHSKLSFKKRSPAVVVPPKPDGRAAGRSFVVPNVVLRDSSDGKDPPSSRREQHSPARSISGTPVKPILARRGSKGQYQVERPSSAESRFSQVAEEFNVQDKYPTEKSAEEKVDEDPSATVTPKIETAWSHNYSQLHNVWVSIRKTIADDSLGSQGRNSKAANGVLRGRLHSLVEKFERREPSVSIEDRTPNTASPEALADRIKSSALLTEEPETSGRDLSSLGDDSVLEDLLQSHDALLSDLRYRLTKLQVVRHFWERGDFKGAINAMKKLPDRSVQADVVSILIDKMELINLDVFSCLLPVLVSLLESETERHAKMSLELLLKLVAVFGRTICATISARPSVGVDLHQEERIECGKQCYSQLQKVQRALPSLARRGGTLAKSALELNLVLQDHNIA